MNAIPSEPANSGPWWRFGMVWLVLGGPLLVVVAAVATAVIAWRVNDPVVSDLPATTSQALRAGAAAPAMQARNHAATPKP